MLEKVARDGGLRCLPDCRVVALCVQDMRAFLLGSRSSARDGGQEGAETTSTYRLMAMMWAAKVETSGAGASRQRRTQEDVSAQREGLMQNETPFPVPTESSQWSQGVTVL